MRENLKSQLYLRLLQSPDTGDSFFTRHINMPLLWENVTFIRVYVELLSGSESLGVSCYYGNRNTLNPVYYYKPVEYSCATVRAAVPGNWPTPSGQSGSRTQHRCGVRKQYNAVHALHFNRRMRIVWRSHGLVAWIRVFLSLDPILFLLTKEDTVNVRRQGICTAHQVFVSLSWSSFLGKFLETVLFLWNLHWPKRTERSFI